MKRPVGVTILAIIFAAAGLSYMMLGFQLTHRGHVRTTPERPGHLDLGLADRPDRPRVLGGWPRRLAPRAVGLAARPLPGDPRDHRGDLRPAGTGNLGYALATSAFPFLLLWYLNRASVKKAFGLAEE